jgi:hypothetical protein
VYNLYEIDEKTSKAITLNIESQCLVEIDIRDNLKNTLRD